jgi:NAD(P)-dependent dehydrogenase (short-subunit alcohol dehydrogenase family)
MANRLDGRVAIVTGAGSVTGPADLPPVGNGRAAAIVYAREGATVIAVDINVNAAEETRQRIVEEGGLCAVFRADVTRAEDCRGIAEQCMKAYGRIDILHNNVGIGGKMGGILDVEEKDWEFIMNVNAKSMFNTCKAVIPHMLDRGCGCILNISSVAAVDHSTMPLFLYSISKSAVNAFTRCLARQVADKGIRVNAIMPGRIDTPMIYNKEELSKVLYDGDFEKMRQERSKLIPMKRMGEPWDIAHAALFLVSDEAKYITGQILAVDGGSMLGVAAG